MTDTSYTSTEPHVFKQMTSLGRAVIKEKNSVFLLEEENMTYASQSITLAFFKGPYEEKEIKYEDITSASLKGTMDKSDLIFAIIFGVIGTVMPLLWIISVFLIFCGIGKDLKIQTKSGDINVPMNGFKYKGKLRTFLNELRLKAPQLPVIEV